MNGFAQHGLDEGAFGEKGSTIVQAFDAFRKYSHIAFCFLNFLWPIDTTLCSFFLLPSSFLKMVPG